MKKFLVLILLLPSCATVDFHPYDVGRSETRVGQPYKSRHVERRWESDKPDRPTNPPEYYTR